jgi:hypothetical protein
MLADDDGRVEHSSDEKRESMMIELLVLGEKYVLLGEKYAMGPW